MRGIYCLMSLKQVKWILNRQMSNLIRKGKGDCQTRKMERFKANQMRWREIQMNTMMKSRMI